MVLIRTMTPNDLEAVAELYQAANTFADRQQILAWTAAGLDACPDLNLVDERDGQVVAAISATFEADETLMIQDIAVLPDVRGQGIGDQLLQSFLQRAKQLSAKKIELWVYWKNARAVPFYYRHGFRLSHIEPAQGVAGLADGDELLYLVRVNG